MIESQNLRLRVTVLSGADLSQSVAARMTGLVCENNTIKALNILERYAIQQAADRLENISRWDVRVVELPKAHVARIHLFSVASKYHA
jgi:hypothetical protein